MTIKAFNAGSLGLLEIRAEFGGPTTNISLFSYRSGGPFVPSGTLGFPRPSGTQILIPSGGTIGINNFYGSSELSYSISVSAPLSMNEPDSRNVLVTTTGVPNGTVLYWSTTGTVLSADFTDGSLTGSVTINSNSGTFTRSTVADALTEGSENFQLQLRTGSIGGPIVAASQTVTVNDTSQNPTYSIVPAAGSVNEGSALNFTVNTTNVPNGTSLFWTIAAGTTNSFDFGVIGSSFTINSNTGTFSVTPTNDLNTEGPETFSVQIRTGSTGGPIVDASSAITVNDTSQDPTYSIVPAAGSVNEGSALNFTVTTTGVPNGTVLYWTIAAGTTNSFDFGVIGSSFTISSNTGTFSVTPTNDLNTEGPETFSVRIRTGSTGGPIVDTSSAITVNDTSQDPTFVFNDTIDGVPGANGGNQSNPFSSYNLRNRAVAAGWNQTSALQATVTITAAAALIGTASVPAWSTGSTAYPVGTTVTLNNSGLVHGRGGNGGVGGFANDASIGAGSNGSSGGVAFFTNRSITVNNIGTIAGGGGGGGGGGGRYLDTSTPDDPSTPGKNEASVSFSAASGGGGGGGQSFGFAGANGAASATGGDAYGPDSSPTSATYTAPGAGSSSGDVGSFGPDNSQGGAGGAVGFPGNPGFGGGGETTAAAANGAGGAAGLGIQGGNLVSWSSFGCVRGWDSEGTSLVPFQTLSTGVVCGGSGGGGGSVSANAFMPNQLNRAGSMVPFDSLILMNEARDGYKAGTVVSNRISMQNLLTLVSESGIELTCSDNTPLTLQDGSAINSTEALNVQLPVLDENGFRWETIVEVRDAGRGEVATIYCLDQCYAAGDAEGRFIFTHNMAVGKG